MENFAEDTETNIQPDFTSDSDMDSESESSSDENSETKSNSEDEENSEEETIPEDDEKEHHPSPTVGTFRFLESKKMSNPFDKRAWTQFESREVNNLLTKMNSKFGTEIDNKQGPDSTQKKQLEHKKLKYYCTGCQKTFYLGIGDQIACKDVVTHEIYRLTDYEKIQKYKTEGITVPCYQFGRDFNEGDKVITCDGSYKKNIKLSTNSTVVRDNNLEFMACSAKATIKTEPFNSNDSETEALHMAIQKACKIQSEDDSPENLERIFYIRSDSKLNVRAFNEGVHRNKKHKGIIREELIKLCRQEAGVELLEKGGVESVKIPAGKPNLIVEHIPRELNQLADLAAKRDKEEQYEIRELSVQMKRVLYEEKDLGIYRAKFPKKEVSKDKEKTLKEHEEEKKLKKEAEPKKSRREVNSEIDGHLIKYQKDSIGEGSNETFNENVPKKRCKEKQKPKKMNLGEFHRMVESSRRSPSKS